MMHKSDIIFANAEIPSEHDFQQIIRILNFDSKRETANTKQLIVYLQAEIMEKIHSIYIKSWTIDIFKIQL